MENFVENFVENSVDEEDFLEFDDDAAPEDYFGGGSSPSEPPVITLDGQEEDELARQKSIIEACINDRIFFCEVVLDVELEPWQRKVLEALDEGSTRISIRSGNGAGKTCLLALIIVHYVLFRNDVKVPVTAPSASQLKDGLIPECHKWMAKLPEFLRKQLDTTQDRIVRRDAPANNFVSFRTARKETPEALQGIHATFVLCVVDEASAVPDAVYEAAQGTMSTIGSIFVMISNPTRLSGYFYNSHHANRRDWRCFHVTAFDTSRVDYTFVDQIARTYGEVSDQYKVRVLGEFPSREEQALISRELVAAAIRRDIAPVYDGIIMGVDVGRGGDASALVVRKGNVIDFCASQNYSDTMQTVGWVKHYFDLISPKPQSIYVDSIGIGAGVADRLRELGLPAVDVNVSESPSLKSVYLRLRDELWWNIKQWIESHNVAISGLSKAHAELLEIELSTPLQLFTSTGKNSVETKTQMRQRGYPSPNLADAACLTFAYEGAVASGAFSGAKSTWNKPLEYSPSGVW